MSKKWTLVGTNALEQYNPQTVEEKMEAKRLAFKRSMKIDKMKVVKPKKKFSKEEANEEEV